MPTIIHWFRRDLRLRDNPALRAALQDSDGRIVPLFVLDDAILRSPRVGAARVRFMLESLRALDEALRERGSRLILRRGRPQEILPALAREAGAEAVYFNRDYTPFARARDEAVTAALRRADLRVESFHDVTIFQPGEVLTNDGRPYTVYTPYRRRWNERVEQMRGELLARHRLSSFAPLPSGLAPGALPQAEELGFTTGQEVPAGGEDTGWRMLKRFLDLERDDGIRAYHDNRDRMALPATSRLSPYLHIGCVSPLTCLREALAALDEAPAAAREGIETWIGELTWHDFYSEILYHFPYVLRGAFKHEYDGLRWENDEDLFAAWREGRTGYPIVDAAMRQLNREAWMHNRARMIVASFLVKDLLIDWRWGERYFLQQLADGDHAANNGGWQWVAGTGTDAQPYFRIFNPVSQGEKFDPEGAYVRRYVPELERVPDRYIHAPWNMPAAEQRAAGIRIGAEYPAPIVDHAARRDAALALYKAVRRG